MRTILVAEGTLPLTMRVLAVFRGVFTCMYSPFLPFAVSMVSIFFQEVSAAYAGVNTVSVAAMHRASSRLTALFHPFRSRTILSILSH